MTTALAHRPNAYAATCGSCRGPVSAQAGALTKEFGAWVVRHLPGQCAPAGSPAIAPAKTVRAGYPDLQALPISKFIVDDLSGGRKVHLEIVERRGGRRYMNLLIGAPGDWTRGRVSAGLQALYVAKIQSASYYDEIGARQVEGPEAAALRFSREHKCCAACMSPLSDESQPGYKRGLGPVCVTRFA